MRFLVDAQLPPALARWLENQGHIAEHVADRDMLTASDQEIWAYALTTGATIITKDEDFAMRRSLLTRGPTIIWIRRGNTTRRELLAWLAPLLPFVLEALERGEIMVEIV